MAHNKAEYDSLLWTAPSLPDCFPLAAVFRGRDDQDRNQHSGLLLAARLLVLHSVAGQVEVPRCVRGEVGVVAHDRGVVCVVVVSQARGGFGVCV